MKKFISIFLCGLMVVSISSCGNMNKTQKGAAVGAGSGAAVGAAVGGLLGKSAGAAAIGATVGTAIGGVAGTLIGKKMDNKAQELASLENAQVTTVTDANGLQSIKVTFDSGILFDTGKSELKDPARMSLYQFASKMKDMPDVNIRIWGHTDNTGSSAINEKLSWERALAVKYFLEQLGINGSHMTTEGKSFYMPVASNDTAAGRALNRRVEVYIEADSNMIQKAQNGNL